MKNIFEEVSTTLPPPHNIEAEQAILGAMLLNNNTIRKVSHLQPEHFFEPLHQRIFECIRTMQADGQRADVITMKRQFDLDESLSGTIGSEYLARIAGAAICVINIEDYSSEIINMANLRKLLDACDNACGQILSGTMLAEEIAGELSTMTSAVISQQESQRIHSDRDVSASIAEGMKTKRNIYKTGLHKLDEAMGGGLFSGKAYGFAARKKVGKTMLAGTISYNLSQAGVKHLFICAEMGEEEIHMRTLARQMDVYPSAFNSDYANSQDFTVRMANAIHASKGNIFYQNAPGLTFEDLKRYVIAAVYEKKVKGVILDYWQLVGGKPKNKSQSEHQDEVAQWMANAGRKMGFWSITMGQINQEGNTRGGEGMRLAFDQVYQLHREDVSQPGAWLEMMDTRYTAWVNVGSKDFPGLHMNPKGPFFEESA